MSLFFLAAYFFWLAVQNFALPWMYQHDVLSGSRLVLLMGSKEALLGAAILLLSFRLWRPSWRFVAADHFALAYLGLIGSYLLFPALLGSETPLSLRVISARGLLSPVLFYFWGRLSFLSLRELRRFVVFLVVLQATVAAFGILERFLLPDSFWSKTVGIGTFMLDVKGLLEGQNVTNGLPSNMFRMGLRRVISTYGDPLAMGIACVFPFLVCLAVLLPSRPHSPRWWHVMAGVIGAALMLTLGRESIGATACGGLLLLKWMGKLRSYLAVVTVSAALVFFLPQIWRVSAETVSFREGSAATHLEFLSTGWRQAPQMLLGKGLGEAGGWAFSLAGVRTDIGESSYFELMAQTGLASVLLLLGFLLSTARRALLESRNLPDPLSSAAFAGAAAHIVGRSLMAVFSSSLFALVPLASFFFYCGAAFTSMQLARSHPTAAARRVLVLRAVPETVPAG